MKRLALKGTSADSRGGVFSSKAGTLKVTIQPLTLTWTPKGKKPTVLSVIPVEANLELIYGELGVYSSKRFGLPCDDM